MRVGVLRPYAMKGVRLGSAGRALNPEGRLGSAGRALSPGIGRSCLKPGGGDLSLKSPGDHLRGGRFDLSRRAT